MAEEIETLNRFGVALVGNRIGMLMPPSLPMTTDEALTLAAWLVTLADYRGDRFKEILEAVRST